jgi:hypothetical protein
MMHFLGSTGNAGLTRQSMPESLSCRLLIPQIRMPVQQLLPFCIELLEAKAGERSRGGAGLSRGARHVCVMSKTFARAFRSVSDGFWPVCFPGEARGRRPRPGQTRKTPGGEVMFPPQLRGRV